MAALGGDGDQDALDLEEQLAALEADMLAAADRLEFEQAAALRDRIVRMKSGEQDSASASSGAGRPRSRAGITTRGRRGRKT